MPPEELAGLTVRDSSERLAAREPSQAVLQLCMTSVRCVHLWAPQSKILIFKGAITEKNEKLKAPVFQSRSHYMQYKEIKYK